MKVNLTQRHDDHIWYLDCVCNDWSCKRPYHLLNMIM